MSSGRSRHILPTVIARLVRAIQWPAVLRAKDSCPADAGLLDYPHEAGNDGVEGLGFSFEVPSKAF